MFKITEDLPVAYLNAIEAREETSWQTMVSVNHELMLFKVDTGAEVTALTEEALNQLGHPQLRTPSKVLCGPDRTPLPPFHTGTAIRIIPGFRHSHGQVNPDSIRIETRIADPGAE